MFKLCGRNEHCFVPGEYGLCKHLVEYEDHIEYEYNTGCDKDDAEIETITYTNEEEYLAAKKECNKGPHGFETDETYENYHFSKRLIKALDKVDDEDLDDVTLWPNRRHSEMYGRLWNGNTKSCFH